MGPSCVHLSHLYWVRVSWALPWARSCRRAAKRVEGKRIEGCFLSVELRLVEVCVAYRRMFPERCPEREAVEGQRSVSKESVSNESESKATPRSISFRSQWRTRGRRTDCHVLLRRPRNDALLNVIAHSERWSLDAARATAFLLRVQLNLETGVAYAKTAIANLYQRSTSFSESH